MSRSRVRWIGVWVLLALWLAGLVFNLGGNAVHVLLFGSIALLVYELLTEVPEQS